MRWVECRGKAIVGVDGSIERLKGFIQDITERKQAEYDQREAKTSLSRPIPLNPSFSLQPAMICGSR